MTKEDEVREVDCCWKSVNYLIRAIGLWRYALQNWNWFVNVQRLFMFLRAYHEMVVTGHDVMILERFSNM
jgi:hypothetical protein